MAKLYPGIGHKKKPRNAGGLPCIICGIPTTGKVAIETNWFRGDDDEVRVCEKHQNKFDSEILETYQRSQP